MKYAMCVLLTLMLGLSAALAESYDDLGFYGECDMWPIRQDGKWGFVDHTGTLIIPCEWEEVGRVVDGRAPVQMSGKWGVIDITGELIDREGRFLAENPWDDMEEFTTNELLFVGKDGKYGYINRQGETVIPLIYDKAQKFSEGLALVKQGADAFWINERGEKVIDRPAGVRSSAFCGDLAAIMNEHGLSGLMDKEGCIVTPCQWENWLTYAFGNGCSATFVTKDDQDGFLNKQGELLTGRLYPKGTIKYGIDGDYLFLLEDGTLSVWHCGGVRVH